MLTIRRRADIHREEGGWFSAAWHLSFGGYRDPDWDHVGPLRVVNDDRLVAGAVWPMHPHRDVEGITYVVEGLFEHADSMGNGGLLRPGAVQRVTLGSGMQHSERNGSPDEPMRFLQLWVLPHTADLQPSIEQRQFDPADRVDALLHVMSPDGDGDTVMVHGDAHLYVTSPSEDVVLRHEVADGRAAYVVAVEGTARLDDETVSEGDAALVSGPHDLRITGVDSAHLAIIDVADHYEPVGVWAGP